MHLGLAWADYSCELSKREHFLYRRSLQYSTLILGEKKHHVSLESRYVRGIQNPHSSGLIQ